MLGNSIQCDTRDQGSSGGGPSASTTLTQSCSRAGVSRSHQLGQRVPHLWERHTEDKIEMLVLLVTVLTELTGGASSTIARTPTHSNTDVPFKGLLAVGSAASHLLSSHTVVWAPQGSRTREAQGCFTPDVAGDVRMNQLANCTSSSHSCSLIITHAPF